VGGISYGGVPLASVSSGIGMTDVAAMMGAIEALHECRVALTGTVRGRGHNGCIYIELTADWARLTESDLPAAVKVSQEWPSGAARTFEGLLYNLCWQLDYAIQQAYEQMKLPGS
jgi:hypothetical protein